MTTILKQEPPAENFLLLKPEQHIRKGDTLIFQFPKTEEQTDPQLTVTNHLEESFTVTFATEAGTTGLMKHYQVIGWQFNEEEKK